MYFEILKTFQSHLWAAKKKTTHGKKTTYNVSCLHVIPRYLKPTFGKVKPWRKEYSVANKYIYFYLALKGSAASS